MLYTTTLINIWIPGVSQTSHPIYNAVEYFTYFPVLGTYNNCNTITVIIKATFIEYFFEIHRVDIDVVSDNRAPVVNKCTMLPLLQQIQQQGAIMLSSLFHTR